MGIYLYLYRKQLRSRIKKLVEKPIALIYTLGILLYFLWLFSVFHNWIVQSGWGTPENFSRILCVFMLYLTPLNFASYARRKGLIFLPGDVQFLFPAPMNPKRHLIYAYGKTAVFGIVAGFLMVPLGVFWFHVSFGRMAAYFLICVVLEGFLEASIVILLYGNEKLGKEGLRFFGWVMYGILACFVLSALYLLYTEGFHWNVILRYFDGEWLGMIPVLGWILAVMRLILLGPTLMNLIGSLLYAITLLLMLYAAFRMKCTGQYYEDAMKFADDYQEALKRNRKGEVTFVGRTKKYRKIRMENRGSGASAVFYRQLLEYKKERFFIFGFITLVFLGAGLVIAWIALKGEFPLQTGVERYYVIPGVMMYLGFLFSGYRTRWDKELDHPYIYLIPDTPFKKMWYATGMDHIRAAVHGILLALPAMAGMKIALWYLPVYLLMQVSMNAVSLYASTVCRYVLGNVAGVQIQRLLQMFIAWFAVVLALPLILSVTYLTGIVWGLLAGSLYLMILAAVLAWAGSRCFARMES